MTQDAAHPFSLARARSALWHFALGKFASAFTGVALLVLLARHLPESDYGVYVTLVALLEVLLLVTNAGAYPIAQRYVTEARLQQNAGRLVSLCWRSVAYRAFTLLVAIGVLAAVGASLLPRIGLKDALPFILLYSGVIFGEGVARYVELILESLLQQRFAQASALLRNVVRCGLLAICVFGLGVGLDLKSVVWVDLAGATLGLLVAPMLLHRYLRALNLAAAERLSAAEVRRMGAFVFPFWVAQLMTQVYSPDTLKLLLARVAQAAEVGAFGLAHVLSQMLQRYLPAQLLLAWLRPLFVSRHADGQPLHEQVRAANLVLKINHFLLAPLIAWLALDSAFVVRMVAGGKHEGAAVLLVGLAGLLILQGLHVVLSMLATAVEEQRAVLWGTFAAAPSLGLALVLFPWLGTPGLVVALWLSEILYCTVCTLRLRHIGVPMNIELGAWLKLAVAAVSAAGTAHLVVRGQGMAAAALRGAVVLVAYLSLCALLKAFAPAERATINRFLPRPMFVF